jgi:hypothetical protein
VKASPFPFLFSQVNLNCKYNEITVVNLISLFGELPFWMGFEKIKQLKSNG